LVTKPKIDELTKIAPVVRGLLAEATGNDDMPYSPVILYALTNQDVTDTAVDAMNVESIESDQTPEETRRQLQAAIDAYVAERGSKPQMVQIGNAGVLGVSRPAKKDPRLPLENKVALVTGAAGAIGYGVCRGLLENGCYLAATDLRGDKLDGFTADLQKTWPDRVVGVPIDVTDKASVAQGIEEIIQTWGGIDIVVINAGIATVFHLKEMDFDAFRRLEKVNVEGTLLTLHDVANHFIHQGTGGDIIIISSKNVFSPGAGFGAYSATKAACHQLGRIASIELADYGIRVNMVAPDAVFSEGQYKSGLWKEIGPSRMKARGLDEKQLQEYYQKRNLLKAKVTGRHVANAVLFFATRQTPTTGATIPVDGGLSDATPR
jgi:NAD(P)-dependent dehydrogenase (short-subunit alcohol dehydrogenase family)